MRKQILFAAALAILTTTFVVAPATAQRASDMFGGDLPQQYGNDINGKFDQMRVEDMLNDPAYMEQFYSKAELEQFFDNTLVKVTFYPDGSYIAYARSGGEVSGVKLGKKSIDPTSGAWESDQWSLRAGSYAAPKRPQSVSLKLAAAGNEVEVECMNKFEQSDSTLTFYVGPLLGLRCLGMVDEEALPFDEVMRTADNKSAQVASSPSS